MVSLTLHRPGAHLQEIVDSKDQNLLPTYLSKKKKLLPTTAQPLAVDTVAELGKELENFKKVYFLTCSLDYDLIFGRHFHECGLNCKVYVFNIYLYAFRYFKKICL